MDKVKTLILVAVPIVLLLVLTVPDFVMYLWVRQNPEPYIGVANWAACAIALVIVLVILLVGLVGSKTAQKR